MADTDNTIDPIRAKKFHEGWVLHQGAGGKDWNKFWMVLRGNMLFIFENDQTSKCEMLGTLTLGPSTEVNNLPSDSKKKGFKFEVITLSRHKERKANKMKFNSEVERDLWKSYVMGISQGIVPSDVHLLPGQLKDVHEAIGEVRNTPPPLPTVPRPNLPQPTTTTIPRAKLSNQQDDGFFFGDEVGAHLSETGQRVSHTNGESANSSFFQGNRSNGPTSPGRKYSYDEGGTVNNLRELARRQSHLAQRELLSTSASEPSFNRQRRESMPSIGGPFQRQNSTESSGSVFSDTRTWAPNHDNSQQWSPTPSGSSQQWSGSHTTHNQGRMDSPQRGVRRASSSDASGDAFVGAYPSVPSTGPAADSSYIQGERSLEFFHPFYASPERNKEAPTWFFASCSRNEAEGVLTVGRSYGNVLMRPSSSHGSSGKYVISMRREVAGGTQLNHYVIVQTQDGFKIDVDNEHSPMRCLSDVMDFFVGVAGPGTNPFRTNDLSKVYSKTGTEALMVHRSQSEDNSFQSSPNKVVPPSPVTPPVRNGQVPDWSHTMPAPVPQPPQPAPSVSSVTMRPSGELHTRGQVSSTIQQAIREMNDARIQPAGSQEEEQVDYTPQPTQSMPASGSRSTGYTDNQFANSTLDYDNNYQNTQDLRGYNTQPPAAPPMPASPPVAPPPPSLAPPPAPPPIQAFPSPSQLAQTSLRPTPQSPTHHGPGMTSGAGFGGGKSPALSFEEELNRKLRPQREQIYARATILRSNFD